MRIEKRGKCYVIVEKIILPVLWGKKTSREAQKYARSSLTHEVSKEKKKTS